VRRDLGRSYFPSTHDYAWFVLASHSRRRIGIWYNNDAGGCNYSSQYILADTGTANTAAVDSLCMGTFGNAGQQQCRDCDQCEKESCLKSLPGCEQFISKLYGSCKENNEGASGWIAGFILIFCGCFCCIGWLASRGQSESIPNFEVLRADMRPSNGHGLGNTRWTGTYTERGETKPTSYEWTAQHSGHFVGCSRDDDGTAEVRGVLSWEKDRQDGKIAWQEFPPHGMMEACGVIRLHGGSMVLDADYYCRSTGVNGKVSLISQMQKGAGPQMPMELQPLHTHGFMASPPSQGAEFAPLRNYAAQNPSIYF